MSYNFTNFLSGTPTKRTKTNTTTTTGGSAAGEAAGSNWLNWQYNNIMGGAPGYGGPNPYTAGPNKWQQNQGQALNILSGQYGSPGGYWDQSQGIYGAVGAMSPDQIAAMNRAGGPGAYQSNYADAMKGHLKKDYGDALAMMKNKVGAGAAGQGAFGGTRHGVAEGVGGARAMDDYLTAATRIDADSYDKGMNWMGQDMNRNIAIANANNQANLGFGNMRMNAARGMSDPTNRLNVSNAMGNYGNYWDNKDIASKSWLKGNWDDRNARVDQWGRDYMAGVSGNPWQTTSTSTGTQTGQGKSNFEKTLGYGLMAGSLMMPT